MERDSLAASFFASQYLAGANLDGISQEESLRLPAGGGNCINWIAGHILVSRESILKPLGGQPWLGAEEAQPYRRGTEGRALGEGALPIDRLREGLLATGREIVERLKGIDPQHLEQPIDPKLLPMPAERPTIGGLLSFLLLHESYHNGQLGLGRRMLGKTGVIR